MRASRNHGQRTMASERAGYPAQFLETMRVLYPEDWSDPKTVRPKKREFLERFMKDGCYLIDVSDVPLDSSQRAAVVRFETGEPPKLYVIPSTAWRRPDRLLVSRDYEGKKSKPA